MWTTVAFNKFYFDNVPAHKAAAQSHPSPSLTTPPPSLSPTFQAPQPAAVFPPPSHPSHSVWQQDQFVLSPPLFFSITTIVTSVIRSPSQTSSVTSIYLIPLYSQFSRLPAPCSRMQQFKFDSVIFCNSKTFHHPSFDCHEVRGWLYFLISQA